MTLCIATRKNVISVKAAVYISWFVLESFYTDSIGAQDEAKDVSRAVSLYFCSLNSGCYKTLMH